jgi:hypothetical protein
LIPLTKKYSEVIARELDEPISAGCIAAGVPPSALQNPQLKVALELIARKVCLPTHSHVLGTFCLSEDHARVHNAASMAVMRGVLKTRTRTRTRTSMPG